jgi:hypothetical protein
MHFEKLLFTSAAVVALAGSAVACGSGMTPADARSDTPAGGGDSGTMNPDTGMTPHDSGSGQPDTGSGQPDTGGTGVTAASLGVVCDMMTPCPANYQCVTLRGGATRGFCSIPCQDENDATTCSNGYPATRGGDPQCLQGMTASGGSVFFCALACMDTMPASCPTGMTCQDLAGPGGVADGMVDTCYP